LTQRNKRKVTTHATKHALLVFAEGEVTEETYLLHWWRKHRAGVSVEIDDFRGSPLQLVQRAVAVKKQGEREEKRGRGPAHDEVWCVFDEDEHPHLDQALRMASDSGIKVAISCPCLELWFQLHFEDQTAYIERGDAQRAARDHLGCGKALTQPALEAMDECYEDAKGRAQALDEKHRGDGTPAPANPSSRVWKIVDSIRSQGNGGQSRDSASLTLRMASQRFTTSRRVS
jgi:hypothetical protein